MWLPFAQYEVANERPCVVRTYHAPVLVAQVSRMSCQLADGHLWLLLLDERTSKGMLAVDEPILSRLRKEITSQTSVLVYQRCLVREVVVQVVNR